MKISSGHASQALAVSEEQTTYQQGRIVYDTFCLEFQELSS